MSELSHAGTLSRPLTILGHGEIGASAKINAQVHEKSIGIAGDLLFSNFEPACFIV
jgi:hypothetical protein